MLCTENLLARLVGSEDYGYCMCKFEMVTFSPEIHGLICFISINKKVSSVLSGCIGISCAWYSGTRPMGLFWYIQCFLLPCQGNWNFHLRVPLWILISIEGMAGFVSSIEEVFPTYVRS